MPYLPKVIAFAFCLGVALVGFYFQRQERQRRIKRSLDALYADQPTKLSPAEWKQIVEEQE
jgi:hypothetical protein